MVFVTGVGGMSLAYVGKTYGKQGLGGARGLLLVCTLLPLFSACTSTGPRVPTLHSLERASVGLLSAESVELSQLSELASHDGDLHAYYRFLSEVGPDEALRATAGRRLADLEFDRLYAADDDEYKLPLELYRKLVTQYPQFVDNDQVLYRLAHVHDLRSEPEYSLLALNSLVENFPDSEYFYDSCFRLGELHFDKGDYQTALDFYTKALHGDEQAALKQVAFYKQAWAQFGLDRSDDALRSFYQVLDHNFETPADGAYAMLENANNLAMVKDSLRGMSLVFMNTDDPHVIEKTISGYGKVRKGYFDHLIYQNLVQHFVAQGQLARATEVYDAYELHYAGSVQSARFKLALIDLAQAYDEPELAMKHKQEFVRLYAPNTAFWIRYDEAVRAELTPVAKTHMASVNQYLHARAQHDKTPDAYRAAEKHYRHYLAAFPDEADTGDIRYMLADLLRQAGDYAQAAKEFETVAYQDEGHNSDEAAYAAVLALREQVNQAQAEQKAAMQGQLHEGVRRYAETHLDDERRIPLLLSLGHEAVNHKQFNYAVDLAQWVLDTGSQPNALQTQQAWAIQGHAAFDGGRFVEAEQAYRQAHSHVRDSIERQELNNWVAASIYQQAEGLRTAGDHSTAAREFLRIGTVAPGADIVVQAEYDAAASWMQMEAWQRASIILENMRQKYPTTELLPDISLKLAHIYDVTGKSEEAAREYERIAYGEYDNETRQEAAWKSADLYASLGLHDRSSALLEAYIRQADDTAQAMEARYRLAQAYAGQNKQHRADFWLHQVIESGSKAKASLNDDSRRIAALAALELAESKFQNFNEVKLRAPLRDNLKSKKFHMEVALKAYNQAAEFGVSEVMTESTYRIGEMYFQFSDALLNSDKPTELSGLELEQYTLMLEEEAIPFEEKAIQILQANTEYAKQGIYDEWVKESFSTLEKVMPMRYRKDEQGEQLVDALE